MGGDRRSPPHHRLKGGGGRNRSGSDCGSGKGNSVSFSHNSVCKNGKAVFKKTSGKVDLQKIVNAGEDISFCREDCSILHVEEGRSGDVQLEIIRSEGNCDRSSGVIPDSEISFMEKSENVMTQAGTEKTNIENNSGSNVKILHKNSTVKDFSVTSDSLNLSLPENVQESDFNLLAGKILHINSDVKDNSVNSDSLNLSFPENVQEPDFELLAKDNLTSVKSDSKGNIITANSYEDRDGLLKESVKFPVTDINFGLQCKDKIVFSQMPQEILEVEKVQDVISDLGLYKYGMNVEVHSNIQQPKELPSCMFLNVINPMFVEDNANTLLDGDCEMLLNVEEDLCKNQNAGNLLNMDADKGLSNWSNNEKIQKETVEGMQNVNVETIQKSNSGYEACVGSRFGQGRTDFRNEDLGVSRAEKVKPNAWKKPSHVQVEWNNQGKASLDGKFVTLNMEAVNQNQARLEKALVGKLIGKRLPYYILENELRKRWEVYGEFRFLMIGEDIFTCIFQNSEARDAVLMGGPWLVGGFIVGLDKWSPTFSQGSMDGLSAPIWIRFPKLPLLYWDNDNLARIASMIGTPLWIDAHTSVQGRCSYARVCVRLDLAQKIPSGVWIHGIGGNFFQHVEFEGLHQVCFKCGHVGHKVDSCDKKFLTKEKLGKFKEGTSHFGWKMSAEKIPEVQIQQTRNPVDAISNDDVVFGRKKIGVKSVVYSGDLKKNVVDDQNGDFSALGRGDCNIRVVGLDKQKTVSFQDVGQGGYVTFPMGNAVPALVRGECSNHVMGLDKQETDTIQDEGQRGSETFPMENADIDVCEEDVSNLGPWIYVSRRKGNNRNGKGSAGRFKSGRRFERIETDKTEGDLNGKQVNRFFSGRKTVNSFRVGDTALEQPDFIARQGIHVDSNAVFTNKGEEVLGAATSFCKEQEEVCTTLVVSASSCDTDGIICAPSSLLFSDIRDEDKTAIISMKNARRDRGACRVPSLKEISRLGPIAFGSRKKRKGDGVVDDCLGYMDDCIVTGADLEFGGKEVTTFGGGDASPLID